MQSKASIHNNTTITFTFTAVMETSTRMNLITTKIVSKTLANNTQADVEFGNIRE